MNSKKLLIGLNRMAKSIVSLLRRHAQLAAAIAATAAVMAAALVLPKFMAGDTPDAAEAMTFADRTGLYAAYASGGECRADIMDSVPPETDSRCSERFEQLFGAAIADENVRSVGEEGMEYISLSGDEGDITLCRAWRQQSGDWASWFDVCFDADTGFVYYVYMSGECVFNPQLYAGAERPDAELILDRFCEEYSLEPVSAGVSGDDGAALYLLRSGGDTAAVSIRCEYDAGHNYDIELSCV